MHRDEIKGKVQQVKGEMKQGIGRATADERLRDEGRADEAEGEVREGVGTVKRNVGDALDNVSDKLKR
jgi:uncharacterized protein YjbJ (UPF0337 family)